MNDERPIETLLRRYAKKRRDEAGAPLEVHPATRRLLQGEVSRQFPRPGTAGKTGAGGWFAAIRQRWVYATAMSVVLVAGVLLIANHQKPLLLAKRTELELAKNQPAPARMPAGDVAVPRRAADAAKPAAPPALLAAPASGAPNNDRLARDLAQAQPASASAERLRVLSEGSIPAAPSSSPRETEQVALMRSVVTKKAPQALATPEAYASAVQANNLGSQTPAGIPAAPAPLTVSSDVNRSAAVAGPEPSSGFAGANVRFDSKLTENTLGAAPALTNSALAFESRPGSAPAARYGLAPRKATPAVSQSFANQLPISSAGKLSGASPALPVLANFRMEQAGAQLRVIDGDGSIYLGELNPVPVARVTGSKDARTVKSEDKSVARRVTAPSAAASRLAQDYTYRAVGTNRTLNQQVVFTWNFVAQTNVLTQSKGKTVGGALKPDKPGLQEFPVLLQNSTINGRAQINAAKEIEINAVPVTR